ncbi:MAG: hypothetical protein ABIJ97_18085 [Bacteroidota bacterium]
MKKFNLLIFFILSFELLNAQVSKIDVLVDYLKTHWNTPDEYIISKFNNHDYIFIGECHRNKQDVDLILNLIPQLYKNGIYNIAIEFAAYEYQYLVDSLLTLPYFDRELAKLIIFKSDPTWGFKEYIDIYKVAWEVNHSKASDSAMFRVINLAPLLDPCSIPINNNFLDYDAYMANVFFKEIVSKKQKGLIYAGAHHTFTKYNQPSYDFEKRTLYGLNTTRMGNIIYDSLNVKTFNIYLHAAWISNKSISKKVRPVNGVIDSVMYYFSDKKVGFDVINSPFGSLTSNNSYYAFGYPQFTLDEFCDGYIYLSAFENFMPITMEEGFITNENINDFKELYKCDKKLKKITVKNANRMLFWDIRKDIKTICN